MALSPAGEVLLPIAAQVVAATDELRRAAKGLQELRPNTLTVAASRTLARYRLPPLIERFSKAFPKVKLRVKHGTLTQILHLVTSGEADFSLSTSPKQPMPDLVSFACYNLGWLLVTRPDHPLLRSPCLSLRDVASFPIITYDETFSSHGVLLEAFRAHGIEPNFALTEADSDIMKEYVRSGIGVAIVKDGAFDPERDKDIGARKLDGLVPESSIDISVRRDAPLTKPAFAFINLLQPKLANTIRARLAAPYR